MDLSPTRRTFLAASLGGAAAVHLAMTPAHASEWVPLAVAFALVGWVQGALAVVVMSSRRPLVRQAAALVSVAALGAWVLSRTVGLPLGPVAWSPEAVGSVDLLCAGLELLTIAAVVVPARRALPRWLGSVALSGIALATTAVLARPSAAEHAHSHEEAAAHDHTGEAASTEVHSHEEAATTPTTLSDTAHAHTEVAAPTTVGTHPPVHDHGSTGAATPGAATPAPPGPDHHGAPLVPGISSPHHHAACISPVTPAQHEAADDLAAATTAQLARWSDLSAAQADGFVPFTPTPAALVHYGNRAWMVDGHNLDPARPESLVYAFSKQGMPILLGAMFLAEGGKPGPQVGGCLTQWHDHTNLCLADRGKGMVGVVDAQGNCPTGSHNQVTAEMLHVWDLPLAAGPFAEATPAQLRDGVITKLRDA